MQNPQKQNRVNIYFELQLLKSTWGHIYILIACVQQIHWHIYVEKQAYASVQHHHKRRDSESPGGRRSASEMDSAGSLQMHSPPSLQPCRGNHFRVHWCFVFFCLTRAHPLQTNKSMSEAASVSQMRIESDHWVNSGGEEAHRPRQSGGFWVCWISRYRGVNKAPLVQTSMSFDSCERWFLIPMTC